MRKGRIIAAYAFTVCRQHILALMAVTLLAACDTTQYSVGGSVTGLAAGASLVLQNNGGDDLTISGNGPFTFATLLDDGAAYAVTLATQPSGQSCSIENGATGSVSGADITNISVVCTDDTPTVRYSVGGTVTGLASGASLILENNGGDDLTITGNGSFNFATPLGDGARYAVTVLTQPSGQTCAVSGSAAGNISGADITNIAVSCTDTGGGSSQYSIGGTLRGLASGASLVLQDNGGDNLRISANGPFTFATPLDDGARYAITVRTQPANQTCTPGRNATGRVNGNDITNISVVCVDNNVAQYSIGGTVIGLEDGNSLVMQNNGGDNLSVSDNGQFTFTTSLDDGDSYSVTVLTQPENQTCSLDNGASGNIDGANITDIAVVCTGVDDSTQYSIGGSVSGLVSGTSLSLQNNGTDDLAISNNGPFTFSAPLDDGAAYAITVLTQPTGQTCSVTKGATGNVAGSDVTDITIDCTENGDSSRYSIGGNVTGLATGTSIVIQNGGIDDRIISDNGSFTFATPVEDGDAYAVTVLTQPENQTCAVASGATGIVQSSDIDDVAIICVENGTTGNTIVVTTDDSFDAIENAEPGDTVLISPGTYHFRLWLRKHASAELPITIKALDPQHRPVFDYTGWSFGDSGVPTAPGSYSSGDAYRSAWRVNGWFYTIDGIIIHGANNAGNPDFDNTAGLRYLNSKNLTIRNCLFYRNDMGVQGGGSNTLIEYTEFDRNGYAGSDQSHNIYILGGDVFTLRYSYSHDAIGGQNFHIRARNAVVAYNWFQNASDYEGDMMTNQKNYDPDATGVQNMLFIGNVVVQKANPDNGNKLFTMYNDTGGEKPTMNLTAVWNTFVFNDRSSANGVVQFSKSTLAGGKIIFSNNIVNAVRTAIITDGGNADLTISGSNNFFPNGSTVGTLTGTIFDTDVGFNDPSANDYTLRSDSAAAGSADTGVSPKPDKWLEVPPPISNPLIDVPDNDHPSLSIEADLATRNNITNLGALQN